MSVCSRGHPPQRAGSPPYGAEWSARPLQPLMEGAGARYRRIVIRRLVLRTSDFGL